MSLFHKPKAQEIEFTCKRCDTKWYRAFVPGQRIVKPSDKMLKGAKVQATASRVSLFGSRRRAGAELQVANLQAEYDRKTKTYERMVHPTCPNCGSGSLTNKVVEV